MWHYRHLIQTSLPDLDLKIRPSELSDPADIATLGGHSALPFEAHLITRGVDSMEIVKDFCKNAAGYGRQKLLESLQTIVKGGELTAPAVNALVVKMGDLWIAGR